METHQLIQSYPPTCHDRIPNFLGSHQAADRLARTAEFRHARVVKVNPSLAQMPLRCEMLKTTKIIFVYLLWSSLSRIDCQCTCLIF